MMLAWLNRITALMPARCIHIGNKPYLIRYHVGRLFGVTVYLHQFLTCDGERDVHDHPWRYSVGIPLTGGYTEERLAWLDPEEEKFLTREIRRFRVNLITLRTFHRISAVKPNTWTLFVHTRRVKGWGFLRHVRAQASPRTWAFGHWRYEQPYATGGAANWARRAPTGAVLRKQLEQGKTVELAPRRAVL